MNFAYLYCVHGMTGHEFCRVCAGKWFVGSGVHPPGGGGGGGGHLVTVPPGVGGGPSSLGGGGGARVINLVLRFLWISGLWLIDNFILLGGF